jgi:cytochrome P450
MAQAHKASGPTHRLPPGPRGLKLLRNSFTMGSDWSGFLSRCAREYGDVIYFRFLNVPICLVVHPDGIEKILVKDQANFLKARDYRALRPILGNGLLTSEGEFWQAQRKLIQPAFRHENIVTYAQVMTQAAASMLAGWKPGETRDVHADMMDLTLEIVAKSLFGSDVSEHARGVGEAMAVVMDLFTTQANWAFVLPDRIPIPKSRRLRQSIKHLNDVVYKLIRDRRKAPVGDDPTAGSDLLSNLLAVKDEGGGRMTVEQLRDEIMTLFLAGHDTTANTLSWTWYLLAQNPKADAALGAELREVLGNRAPAPADLPRLPYTEMIMKESMRLYPPAWGVGRRAIHDFELDGYRIPAKTNFFLLQWVTQRDARFFPDPERFDPERWRHDPIRNGKIPRFSYFPFGGGPRVCVGAGFAMMEATLLLATIAQKFRLTLASNQSIEPLFSVTLRPKNGIRMHLHPRTN